MNIHDVNCDRLYVDFFDSFKKNYSRDDEDNYYKYNAILKQRNSLSYTKDDFFELICLLLLFHFLIGKKEHSKIYPALTSLNEFLYDEYEINHQICFSLLDEISFPVKPEPYHILLYKENSTRVIATITQRIKEFLTKASESLSLYSPAQRKDSEKKGYNQTPRYYIHGDTLHSALILFRWYDGRDFRSRSSQRNMSSLPRKTISCSREGYVNCINYVLNSKDTFENLYAAIDINKHMKYLYLICFNYYMDQLSNDEFLECIFKSCNLSYKEAQTLDKYFVSAFTSDHELMFNIFSLEGILRLEYFYTYLYLAASVHDATKTLDIYFRDAKDFCLSEEHTHPIYEIINQSFTDISNSESQIAYKQLIEMIQSKIYDNSCWQILCNYIDSVCSHINDQKQLSDEVLFAHIESDVFFKLISPYFFD